MQKRVIVHPPALPLKFRKRLPRSRSVDLVHLEIVCGKDPLIGWAVGGDDRVVDDAVADPFRGWDH